MTEHDLAILAQAIAPIVREAVASAVRDAETRLAVAEAQLKTISDVRDRVLVIETKAAVPVAVLEAASEPVDLSPVLERVAGLEARLTQALALEPTVSALRDRVVVVETKSMVPALVEAPDTLTPVLERLAANDARVARLAGVELTVSELHDKFVALEAKAAVPVEPHRSGPSAAEIELSIRDATAPLLQALAEAQARIAVLEVKSPVPGPAGVNGKDGLNGKDGKDGADGVSLDDLSLVQDADRTMTVKGTVGSRVKDIGSLTFPVEIYRGVYVEGKTYDRGDCVTFGGSEFHCNEPTTTKPEQSKAWTLKVKRGRDGKDGRDAETVKVVSLGRPS